MKFLILTIYCLFSLSGQAQEEKKLKMTISTWEAILEKIPAEYTETKDGKCWIASEHFINQSLRVKWCMPDQNSFLVFQEDWNAVQPIDKEEIICDEIFLIHKGRVDHYSYPNTINYKPIIDQEGILIQLTYLYRKEFTEETRIPFKANSK